MAIDYQEYNHEKEPIINGSAPGLDVLLSLENLPPEFKTTWGLKVQVDDYGKDRIFVDMENETHEYKDGPVKDIAVVLRRMYVASEFALPICVEDYDDSRVPTKLLESSMKLFMERLNEAEKGGFAHQRITLTDKRPVSWFSMDP